MTVFSDSLRAAVLYSYILTHLDNYFPTKFISQSPELPLTLNLKLTGGRSPPEPKRQIRVNHNWIQFYLWLSVSSIFAVSQHSGYGEDDLNTSSNEVESNNNSLNRSFSRNGDHHFNNNNNNLSGTNNLSLNPNSKSNTSSNGNHPEDSDDEDCIEYKCVVCDRPCQDIDQ